MHFALYCKMEYSFKNVDISFDHYAGIGSEACTYIWPR